MPLVAGIDSSTQSCKVVITDADSGELVRSGSARHPDGTEVAPSEWERARGDAVGKAGGLDDVAAVAVAAQQHGMICLDEGGAVIRPALLWNDTRFARQAADLVDETEGGAAAWASAVGSVPVAALTVSKLRWLAETEPDNARRVAMVCLPHDRLSWRLSSSGSLGTITTDRSDASGTGYWSPSDNAYRHDLLASALGHDAQVPAVLGPADTAGGFGHAVLAAGAGDNAASALALDIQPGDVIVSIGTSGVASTVTAIPVADASGGISGFADATGRHLPLVCTLNAARVLDATANMLGVTLGGLSGLACTAANMTPAHVARAAVEGMLCGLADGVDALSAAGCDVRRVLLIGGGARSAAVQQIAPAVLGSPIVIPHVSEYAADGAARQAAWALRGGTGPPVWSRHHDVTREAQSTPFVRERYAQVRELTAARRAIALSL
jgi:xylulokinase